MSETKFDPRKFAAFKFKAASEPKKVLKADKGRKAQQTPQVPQASQLPLAKEFRTDTILQELAKEKQQEPAQPQVQKKPRPARRVILSEILITALVAFIIAFLIRTFIVQIVYVPTSGMEPMLKAGDRVVVNKLIFGFVGNKKPARGDVVVFEQSKKAGYQIKRVIGLPGEKIKIKGGQAYINGKAIKEGYPLIRGKVDLEQVQITRGSYFMLGDNRDKSLDSRTYGAIPISHITGPVVLRIWPIDKFTVLK